MSAMCGNMIRIASASGAMRSAAAGNATNVAARNQRGDMSIGHRMSAEDVPKPYRIDVRLAGRGLVRSRQSRSCLDATRRWHAGTVRTLVAVVVLVAACGGGEHPPWGGFFDSGPAPPPPPARCPICGPVSGCTVDGLPTSSIRPLALDGGAGPDAIEGTADDLPFGPNACGAGTENCDFFKTPNGGANTGKKAFLLVHHIPDDVDGDGTFDLNTFGPESGNELDLVVELVPTNGTFTTGSTLLSTAPDAFVSSVFLPTPSGTTSFTALAYVAVLHGKQITNVYTSISGMFTIAAIDLGGDTPNTLIQGSLSAINLVETDGTALFPGGCLEGFNFTLEQGNSIP